MILVLVFVVGLLVMFAAGYQIAEKKMLAPKKRAEAIAPPPSDLPALACEALVTRVFEQRLVDAGIMTVAEMSVCEDKGCADCRVTRLANRKCAVTDCNRVGTKAWKYNRVGIADILCPECYDTRLEQERINPPKKELPKPPKGKGGGSPKFAKQGEQFIRITENGKNTREIPWPESVPSHASVTVDNNYNGYKGNTRTLMFKWTDEATGYTMSKTMLVPVLSWQPETNWTVMGDDKPLTRW